MNKRFRKGTGAGSQDDAIPPHTHHTMNRPRRILSHLVWLAALALALLQPLQRVHAADTSPTALLALYSAQAGSPGQAERGRVFFTSKHGAEWSCASCHGNPPTRDGRHASTGKTLSPMAPAANRQAFTQTSKVDKWFRRNCREVLDRECSAGEKADVMSYLIGLRP
jgi:cytochrome c553